MAEINICGLDMGRGDSEPGSAVFPGSAEAAHLAPPTLFGQRFVRAVMLDARRGLYKDGDIQRLTEPFEAYEGDTPDLREAYEELCAMRPAFNQLVRQAVCGTGVILEGPSRVKSVRSAAAKAFIRLSKGGDAPIIDGLGARVVTEEIAPPAYVAQLRRRARLPEVLPGGVSAIQRTGSIHSVMYQRGRVGHKLAVPIAGQGEVWYGELLVYHRDDLRLLDLTRAGFEAARLRALHLAIGTPAVNRLEAHYEKTIDRWKLCP